MTHDVQARATSTRPNPSDMLERNPGRPGASVELALRYSLRRPSRAAFQGLTLVRFSAPRKGFLWHRGCSQGLLRGCLGGVRG